MTKLTNAAWTAPTRLDSSAFQMSSESMDFVLRIFRAGTPSPGDIRCAGQALRRLLQGGDGIGWLIWDQVAGWRPPAPRLARDIRALVKAHPPWSPVTTAERRRLAARRDNRRTRPPGEESTSAGGWPSLDQDRVAMFQGRIRQWVSKCYDAPLSNPRWEALLRETNADKAARFRIMEKARAGGLVPAITRDMLAALKRAQAQEYLQEQRERAQRGRQKQVARIQQEREAAWRRQRALAELTKTGILDAFRNRIAELERILESGRSAIRASLHESPEA